MKGNELELWIASLTICNFIIVQSNHWMLIVNKHCAIFTTSIRRTPSINIIISGHLQGSKLKKMSGRKFATSYENLVATLKMLVAKLIEAI